MTDLPSAGVTPVTHPTQCTSNVSALYATAAAGVSTGCCGAALPGQLPYASL
jgi:hypothetical protein